MVIHGYDLLKGPIDKHYFKEVPCHISGHRTETSGEKTKILKWMMEEKVLLLEEHNDTT